MPRENKIGLLVGLAFIMLFAIMLSEQPIAAQTMKLDGTSSATFKIGLLSGTRCTLTNSSGALSLSAGLTVSGGTVNLSGATLTMPASLSLTAISCSGQITSTLTTGTAPFSIVSTTKVPNLNVDATDGISLGASGANGGIVYQSSSTLHDSSAAGSSGQLLVSGGSGAPTWTSTPSATTYTATQTTGTAPLTISSTTVCTNLNADKWDGYDLTSGSTGGVIYQSGSNAATVGAAGTSGQHLISGGSSAPTWAGLTSANLWVGNGSNIPTAVTLSGDVTMDNAGVVTIGSNAISGGELASGSVSTAKLDSTLAALIPTGTWTVGAEASDVINIQFQMKDANGNNLAQIRYLNVVLSDSSTAGTNTGQSPTWVVNAGSLVVASTANKRGQFLTDATGLLNIDVTLSGDFTLYAYAFLGSKTIIATLDFN